MSGLAIAALRSFLNPFLLVLVAGHIANGPTAGREQENRDREKILHHPTPFHPMTLKHTSSL